MRVAALRNDRLRLSPDVDPEKSSYDDYAIESVNVVAGTTGLASAASLPATMLRRLWETSKLALSLFSRKPAASSSPAPPMPLPIARSPLPDVSASSRSAAGSASPGSAASGPAFDVDAAFAFCQLYAGLVAPRQHVPGSGIGASASDADPIVGRHFLLNALTFAPELKDLPLRLWSFAVECCDLPSFLQVGGRYSPNDLAFPPFSLPSMLSACSTTFSKAWRIALARMPC
jgi:hypothetical protein